MLFRETWEKVLDGTKTEIRLPVKPGEKLVENSQRVMIDSRTKWKVGNSYAVQPRHQQKAVGRILLQEIQEGLLGQMGPSDIQAEGFTCLDDFIAAWEGTHGNYDPEQPVWILRFERERTPEERAARKRKEQEERLWRMANEQSDKLSEVGHELGEWQQDGDLRLKNTCRRCDGSVTVSVGEISMIGHVPLMQPDFCFADYPEQMEAAQREWQRRLASAYELILSWAEKRKRREAESETDEST